MKKEWYPTPELYMKHGIRIPIIYMYRMSLTYIITTICNTNTALQFSLGVITFTSSIENLPDLQKRLSKDTFTCYVSQHEANLGVRRDKDTNFFVKLYHRGTIFSYFCCVLFFLYAIEHKKGVSAVSFIFSGLWKTFEQ